MPKGPAPFLLATMAEQSPISSSFSYGWSYDVFINFRGEDTRFDFARNLYEALQQKGIHAFIDNERLIKGEKITRSLLKAIQESRMAITIFSRNYASSTFCLDELVQILEHINKKGRLVLPIFYDVDPSEVRHQRKDYGEVFAQHERRFKNDKEKVQKWKRALQDAASLSGLHFKPGYQYECAFIKAIVKEVTRKIHHRPLHIADYPVGLEPRVLKVSSLLDVGSNEGVQMVGICGNGGIGKSTIARAVYNLIGESFESFCFLADVRENSINHGLVYLQETLLSEVLGEDIKLRDVNKGIPIIKHRLHKKKVLLVLDDVDKLKQLQAIAGGLDWFGSGSRIIVTTRDKHLLVSHDVERIYEVDCLNKEEGIELLKWHAFKQSRVDASYMDVLNNVVLYACGLPLALEVVGSNLFSREISDWTSAIESYHNIPIKEIQQILKVSYDALEEYEQEIFLDMACFFKGDSFEYVRSALYARGICPDYGFKVLIDKCLIKINHGKVTMHDLIQAMGKEIVRQKSPYEPGNRSRLWFHKDILHVLEENKGSGKIEAINLDMPGDIVIDWSGKAFKKMPNLKILIIRNAQFSTGPKYLPNSLRVLDWKGYPCPSLPSDFNPKELIILKMPESSLKRDVLLKKFHSLSVMNFRGCKFLRRVSDLSAVPDLRELSLERCIKLTEVHVSIGFLGKLKRLSVKNCWKLKAFPSIKLTSLESLDLSGCSSLTRFPDILGTMENIKCVCLDYSGIEELPLSFKNLVKLEKLRLSFCRSIKKIQSIPPNLKELSAVNLDWYSHLSSESRNILLCQALHEVDGLKLIVEGDKTPEWLDHYVEGDSWSFWFQNEFPNMAVCFATLIEHPWHSPPKMLIAVRVNGTDVGFPEGETVFAPLTTPHIFLFDLRRVVLEDKLKSVVSESGWNHVEISCVLSYWNCYHQYHLRGLDELYGIARAKWSGAYVYKQKSSMEYIRFVNHSQEAVPELLKGSSMNPSSFAELVLRRMKSSPNEIKAIEVVADSSNNAVMSVLSKPITELRKRKRNERDLSTWIPHPLIRSLLCPPLDEKDESEGRCQTVTKD